MQAMLSLPQAEQKRNISHRLARSPIIKYLQLFVGRQRRLCKSNHQSLGIGDILQGSIEMIQRRSSGFFLTLNPNSHLQIFTVTSEIRTCSFHYGQA